MLNVEQALQRAAKDGADMDLAREAAQSPEVNASGLILLGKINRGEITVQQALLFSLIAGYHAGRLSMMNGGASNAAH